MGTLGGVNLEDIDKLKSQSLTLPDLLTAAIRAEVQRKENADTNPVISQETLALLAKETAAPPPVSLCCNSRAA